jgi:hypothetical protein
MTRQLTPIVLALITASALVACGPTSPELAATPCEERARAATGPTGSVSVGVSNRGPVAGLEIGVTDDYLQGRDPYVVYDQCVRAKSGQGPIRPLKLD